MPTLLLSTSVFAINTRLLYAYANTPFYRLPIRTSRITDQDQSCGDKSTVPLCDMLATRPESAEMSLAARDYANGDEHRPMIRADRERPFGFLDYAFDILRQDSQSVMRSSAGGGEIIDCTGHPGGAVAGTVETRFA